MEFRKKETALIISQFVADIFSFYVFVFSFLFFKITYFSSFLFNACCLLYTNTNSFKQDYDFEILCVSVEQLKNHLARI